MDTCCSSLLLLADSICLPANQAVMLLLLSASGNWRVSVSLSPKCRVLALMPCAIIGTEK